MPGTIHVSVLDFKGISFSSISIKASMGKREFQIWDKGDFSFPVTTLRDNLIITLQDAEGNQISHAEIRTMSIVEKVVWDDFFPLEGGGHIHMKLQFILSDEERNRVRSMRETALKKKQGVILNSTLKNAETASNSTISSLRTHEVSDSRTSDLLHNESANAGHVAVKAHQLSTPNTSNENAESRYASDEGTLERQTTPNATDRRKEASSSSMSEGAGLHQKPLVEVENELVRPNLQVGPILLQEASSFCGSSRLGNDLAEKLQKQSPVDKIHSDVKEKSEGKEILIIKKNYTSRVQHADISTRLQESSQEVQFPKSAKIKSISPEVSDKIEKLGLTQKAPSNIRKMISAFESSLAQDRGPATKPLAVKSQSNRVGMVHLLKDQVLNAATEISESSSGRHENPTMSSLERLKNSFSAGDLQRTPANILKKGEQTSFQKDFGGFKSFRAMQLTESNVTKPQPTGMDASVLKDELGSAHRDIIPRKTEKSLEDIKRPSAMEEATFSGRKDRETIEKDMKKFKLPSLMEEGTGSGRVQKERDPAGMLIVKNELRSSNKETNSKELATSDSMRPSTLEAATISGRIPEVGERDFGRTSVVMQEFISAQKETNTKGMVESPGDFTRSSTLEAGTHLGTADEHQDSSGKPVVEGRGKRISSTKISPEINTRGASKDNLEYFPNESSSTWLFPDDRRHLCITAEGDKLMNSLGGCIVEENHHEKKIVIVPENIGKDMNQRGTDAEVKSSEEKFNSSSNSCPESSAHDASSTGPLGQVIKIAVVVGFGLLVLLTRQRQPRKAKRKETDPPFGTGYLMDQHGSIEEQLKKINIF